MSATTPAALLRAIARGWGRAWRAQAEREQAAAEATQERPQ